MRLYAGAPRHNYEDILRSIGWILDQRGMRDVLLVETDEGYIVQGMALVAGEDRPSSDPSLRLQKQTVHLLEDDIARLMDEAFGRRNKARARAGSQFYEQALRVLGAYFDEQQPRDIFFLEQDHQFVVRLLMSNRAGPQHVLVEFTREEIEAMIEAAGRARR